MMIKIAIATRKEGKHYQIDESFLTIAKQQEMQLFGICPGMNDYTQLAEELDGLLLPGGCDVIPSFYGKDMHPSMGEDICLETDEMDIALIHAFHNAGKPILGICRGMQILNVAMQGTMIQHLPDINRHHTHDETKQYDHPIKVAPSSYISTIFKDGDEVNSFHHQAVDVVGNDLCASAWAMDGTIEAIEGNQMLGVQWHPEWLLDDALQMQIFNFLKREDI